MKFEIKGERYDTIYLETVNNVLTIWGEHNTGYAFRHRLFDIHEEDVPVALEYFKHRLNNSKRIWVSLCRSDFRRNKLATRMKHSDIYSGCSIYKKDLDGLIQSVVAVYEEEKKYTSRELLSMTVKQLKSVYQYKLMREKLNGYNSKK